MSGPNIERMAHSFSLVKSGLFLFSSQREAKMKGIRYLTILLCLSLYSPAQSEEARFLELGEVSKGEIEEAWAEVKKPIPMSVRGGVYADDQSAIDAFMKGFVRRLNVTHEFGISYTYPPEKGDDYRGVSYMLNVLMDETKGELYYGYISVSRIHLICRCQDGFDSTLLEEIAFSSYIFSNYSISRLGELGAEYAQKAYDAIERDLLKDKGYFYIPERGYFISPLKRKR
jgi:hypothetical protein